MKHSTVFLLLAALLTVQGCEKTDDYETLDISGLTANYNAETNPYAKPELWLSGPGAAEDFVLSVNLDTTIVHADLTTEVIRPKPAADPDLDIFYIHPTVNLDPLPGNDDLSDLTNTKSFVTESAARFSTVGRVITPLYHSATAGCFLADEPTRDACLELAYQDVEDAFVHYLVNHWQGRKLAIMGYSQGAVMTRMLMQRLIKEHPALMRRVAAVIPMSGDLKVDSFNTIAACETDDQTGCYITYHAFLDGAGPQPGTLIGDWSDSQAACTDVAGAAGQDGLLTMSYFSLPSAPDLLPSDALAPPPIAIDTPFIAFPLYYAAACDSTGGSFLKVWQAAPASDQRWAPIDYNHMFVLPDPPFGLGLHIFDWSLAMGDLLYLVQHKAAKLEGNGKFLVMK